MDREADILTQDTECRKSAKDFQPALSHAERSARQVTLLPDAGDASMAEAVVGPAPEIAAEAAAECRLSDMVIVALLLTFFFGGPILMVLLGYG